MAPKGSALRRSGHVRRESEIQNIDNGNSTAETGETNDSPPTSLVTTEQRNASGMSIPQQVTSSDTIDAGSSDADQSAARPVADRSSPVRRPERLESLHSSHISSTNERSSLVDPSAPRPANLRFKPKSSIRRTREQRETDDRADAERKQTGHEAVEDTRGTLISRGRGRGHVLVSSIRDERLTGTGATGHLGAKFIDPSKARRGGRGGRGGSVRNAAPRDDAPAPDEESGSTEKASAVKAEKDKDGDIVMDTSKPKASKPRQSQSGTKRGSTEQGRGRSAAVKQEPQIPECPWSDEEELKKGEGRRIDIERINISSDEEVGDEDLEGSSGKGKERQQTPQHYPRFHKPIRLDRREHKERAVGVNTDASSITSAELRKRTQEGRAAQGSLFLDSEELTVPTSKPKSRGKTRDVEFVRNERKWQGVYRDEEDDSDTAPKIKKEPRDNDLVVIDETPIAFETSKPKSPDAEATRAADDVDMEDSSSQTAQAFEDSAPESLETKLGRPKPKGLRHPKPVLQTDEDHQEWARHTEDLQILSKSLHNLGGKVGPATKTADEEGNLEMEDPDDEGHHSLELYVFQFPPALPMLVDPKTQEVKAETTNQPHPASTLQAHELSAPHEASSSKTSAKKGATKIPNPTTSSKSKPDTSTSKAKALHKKPPKIPNPTEELSGPSEATEASLPPPPQTYTPISALPPAGLFGQLRLHESKRTTADWGSLLFEIGRGSEQNMAQEVVVCDWSKVVVKKEEWETDGVGGGVDGGGEVNKGDQVTVKEEEREMWREEINCGEKVWGMDEVGRQGARAAFVGVPDFGGMFGV